MALSARGGSWTARLLSASLVALALPASGCLVGSRCRSNQECDTMESCNLATGECYVQCRRDHDCYVNGAYVGKQCLDHRCEFLYSERVPAPEFGLKVLNPASQHYGKELLLSQLRGQVVLLFFGSYLG